jgi:regulator of protease activity HflC (stomatin/prohibitin superfamily)
MAILGEGKSELLDKAKSKLNKDLEEYGIEFKTLAFSNTPQPEAKIQVSIDESVQAQQRAVAAQNKVLEAKALADQEIEKARGKAESVKIAALAQLEAAASEAKANELLSKSLTSELVRVKMIEKWDGALPKFSGESTPLISFDSVKK